MSPVEAIWSFGLLGLLLLLCVSFMRYRRRTDDFGQMRHAKQRLSPTVRTVEKLTLYALALVTGGAIFVAFTHVHSGQVTGATAVYATVGAFLVAIPVGGLGANGMSWFVPPLRRANLSAMSGSNVSFASANRGLVFFAAVSIPAGLIALTIAALEPWVR
jgi:hypothetical protein